MQITGVETFAPRIPLKPECCMVSALGSSSGHQFAVVRLLTDSEYHGVGEASVTVRWSGETATNTCALIHQVLGPAIMGMDPTDIQAIDEKMDAVCADNWFAKSALEMACWDVRGKEAGVPVYELLGGAVRPLTIRSRFSLGAYDVPRAQSRVAELIEMGFDTIKVKVGGRAEDDIARVRAVREVIGPDRFLVIDANCGWDTETAIYCINQLADCRIDLAEQPTPKRDYEAMARVRRETNVPILADDTCFDLVDAQELIRNDCCDAISVYPGKNGGIRKAAEIVDFAAQHGVACSIGSNLEWDVATAAMAHLIVSRENMQVEKYPGDLLGPFYHQQRIARNPLEIQGPLTTLHELPGLGIDVAWDELASSQVAG